MLHFFQKYNKLYNNTKQEYKINNFQLAKRYNLVNMFVLDSSCPHLLYLYPFLDSSE